MNNSEQQQVRALNLKEIVDVSKLNIRPDSILIKSIRSNESEIILPNGVNHANITILEVIKVGDKVDTIKVGDIIIDFVNESNVSFYYKKDDNYLLTDKYNVSLWTTKENYDVV
jgi:hypothetical protein